MHQILAFILISLSLSASPGPANVLLFGLGAARGVRKNLPFYGGIILAETLIAAASLAGLRVLFKNSAIYLTILIAGSLYMIYLAIKLIRLPPFQPNAVCEDAAAHRFGDAVLMSVLNPKYYVAVTVVFAQFAQETVFAGVSVLFGWMLVVAVAHFSWLCGGAFLRRKAQHTRYFGLLNKFMGSLLMGLVLYLLYAEFGLN